MNPKVTVLMPAYNAGKYIAESIQSVIDQTYSDWELLVVNDGSTDNTVEVVEGFSDPRVRLLNNPENLRLIKTLNRGLEEARGEYVARLDADDRALPERLRLQVEVLDNDSDLVLIGGRSNVICADGEVKRRGEDCYAPESCEDILMASMFYNPFRHSSVTFRREAVLSLGGYPAEFQDVEDFALWTKLLENYRAVNLKEVVCDYRIHPESVMQSAKVKSARDKFESRVEITRPLYLKNALRMTGDYDFSDKWSKEWPKVQYAYQGQIDFNFLLKSFRIVLSNNTGGCARLQSHPQVLIQPLHKFSRFSWTRKSHISSIRARLLLKKVVRNRQI